MKLHRYALALLAGAGLAGTAVSSPAKDASYAKIQRGHYLVTAGDCVACHTTDGGKPFAGGRAVPTPFGTIYSPNITPDRQTGIGSWSDDDFYRALHTGIAPGGRHLYPAFPYPNFTRMTREDVGAIHAYLDTLQPVRNDTKPPDLVWPLDYRIMMRGWNWMYFEPGTFHPDPDKSEEWNRGAYLVQGAGHCGACHTPKNFAGAAEEGDTLQGGEVQNWFAPKLANGKRAGLGSWSADDVVEYLRTGRNRFSGATGLMAEVVANSTSKLTGSDLHAIAVYLKDVAGTAAADSDKPDSDVMTAGSAIFHDSCSGCHQADGKGVPRMFPPLAGNANVQSEKPTSIVRVILNGAQTVPTDARPTPFAMPAFGWKLSDAEIAAVATYVRNAWGNSASHVSENEVATLRQDLHASAQ